MKERGEGRAREKKRVRDGGWGGRVRGTERERREIYTFILIGRNIYRKTEKEN